MMKIITVKQCWLVRFFIYMQFENIILIIIIIYFKERNGEEGYTV